MNKQALPVFVLAIFLLGCGPTPEATEGRALGETQTRPADGMVTVYVPAGEFAMGSPASDADAGDSEFPQHTVYLDAFWIDKYEVTNAQFAAFLNDQGNQVEGEATWLDLEGEGCLIEEVGEEFRPKNGYAEYPVVEVSWYGAAAYCEWAGGRLPTEAEWEYAARGPDASTYPWGDVFDGRQVNYCDANCVYDNRDNAYDDGYGTAAPVGSYPSGASWCGALDLAGNVWEWVADWYDPAYYASSPLKNPQGPGSGVSRALRGGAWFYPQGVMRSAHRGWDFPTDTDGSLGFRCVSSAR